MAGHAQSSARELWLRYELIHDLTYFSPVALARAKELGMRGFWMGYFALRSAPLGTVDPAIVTASFFGFHSSRVARALPDAWLYTTPERALAARLEGAEAALSDIGLDPRVLEDAADLLWHAADAADTAGRPLAAANQALGRPESPARRLWQATATLREHRGDGHIAALVTAGVTPAESHQVKIAAGESDPEALRAGRGFPDDEWQRAFESLVARGWLDASGGITEAGRRAHAEIEATTDRLAATPWNAVGPAVTEQLLGLLDPIARAVAHSGLIPLPNPVGLVWDVDEVTQQADSAEQFGEDQR
jgi:hypothetical protein